MNIVALATPYGVGAISIIRLSGKDALSIADKISLCPAVTPILRLLFPHNELQGCKNQAIKTLSLQLKINQTELLKPLYVNGLRVR